MLIKVTAEHLAKGTRASSTKCALATAIQEQTGELWSVSPQVCCAHVARACDPGDAGYVAPLVLPAFVCNMLESWDRSHDIQPFELELPVEDYLRKVHEIESKNNANQSNG